MVMVMVMVMVTAMEKVKGIQKGKFLQQTTGRHYHTEVNTMIFTPMSYELFLSPASGACPR